MAFRPRLSPCSISSRYGSQALGARSWLPVGGEIGWPKSGSPHWPVLPALAAPASRWSYRDPGSPTKLSNHDNAVLQFLPREQAPILATHSERPAEVRFSPSLQAKGFFASGLR